MLEYSPNATDPQKRSYEAVPIPSWKHNAIKLVSTYRTTSRALLLHSAMIRRALARCTETPLDYKQVALPISAVSHLLFQFDRFSEESMEAQIAIELPHFQTRADPFKKAFFSMG